MNNSKLAIESIPITLNDMSQPSPRLKEREGELVQIIEAVNGIAGSKEWSTLKIRVFDGKAEQLNRELLSEAKKEIPDTLKLNRLAGELKWAERYSDLSKLEATFRLELRQVRQQLYGKEER